MKKIFEIMDFEFWGTGKHKIAPEKFIETKDVLLLDVRSTEEASTIAINETNFFSFKYLNIPFDKLSERLDEIPKNKLIVTFCPGKSRATIAFAFLINEGYNAKFFDGGYNELTSLFKTGKIYKASKK
ncbi:MAG: hypothetical protein J7L15_09340 [Clostridiales bacterium]|nr:hypothetical protein [Clostridiales bacterium]